MYFKGTKKGCIFLNKQLSSILISLLDREKISCFFPHDRFVENGPAFSRKNKFYERRIIFVEAAVSKSIQQRK